MSPYCNRRSPSRNRTRSHPQRTFLSVHRTLPSLHSVSVSTRTSPSFNRTSPSYNRPSPSPRARLFPQEKRQRPEERPPDAVAELRRRGGGGAPTTRLHSTRTTPYDFIGSTAAGLEGFSERREPAASFRWRRTSPGSAAPARLEGRCAQTVPTREPAAAARGRCSEPTSAPPCRRAAWPRERFVTASVPPSEASSFAGHTWLARNECSPARRRSARYREAGLCRPVVACRRPICPRASPPAPAAEPGRLRLPSRATIRRRRGRE